MSSTRAWLCVAIVAIASVTLYAPFVHAEKVYGPGSGSCIVDGPGPNGSAALRSGTLQQAPQQCEATNVLYTSFLLPHLDDDIDLLLSGDYFSTGYPYMDSPRINIYLNSLDADSANEFHKPWRDFQLNFNYFQGSTPSGYYGTFGAGNPSMDFELSNVPDDEERHVDIYLRMASGGGLWPSSVLDPQEDGSPTSCADDYHTNSFSLGAGLKASVGPCGYVHTEDPNWHVSGERATVLTQHEFQHLNFASRGGNSQAGFPNEMFSMAAEYLVGASVRDGQRAISNLDYDLPLVNVVENGGFKGDLYQHWYLWGVYLSQHFSADTTQVEDDLLYKWVRNKNAFGVYDQEMHGLAHVLEAPEYAGLGGSTGAERLRNLYHNYVLAKWINNPSPSFYGGRLGFTRGILPSVTPGFFDNTFAPFAKASALEVPPRFPVGQERVGSDLTYPIGGLWQVTDTNCGVQQVSTDSIGIWLYGSDYIQFDAGSYFQTNGKQNTLSFRMFWDPAQYPGGGSKNSLRVAAISYSASTGDSLYLKGNTVNGISYAFVDSLHGFAQVWVPSFGGATKSVVIAIDMGEVAPASGGRNPRKLYYGYSFHVDESIPPAVLPLNLTISRPAGQTYAALQWSDPSACGTTGYTIQRSANTVGNFSTFATVPAGTYARNDTIAATPLTYYRIFATGAPTCSSNFATAGGVTSISQSLAGVVYLSGDLTMTGVGRVLTVLPRTTVLCAPNVDNQQGGLDPSRVEVRLVSGAQIQAIGTASDSIRWGSASSSPASGQWRGIYLQLSDSSPSRFEYNSISHAVHGIHAEYLSAPTIDHSAIRHSQFYGVWAFNFCSPKILNSIFEQNHGAEIAISGNSSSTVRNSFLRYSPTLGPGAVDDGIVYTVNSGGVFRRNRVSGVGMGMYCVNSSSPTLVGQGDTVDSLKFGRNDILNFRYYGVRTYDEGLPELGTTNQATSYLAGRNDVFSSSFPSAIWIEHSSTTNQLSAKHNYWGAAPPDGSRFVGNIVGYQNQSQYLAQFEGPAGPNQYYPGYQTSGSLATPEAAFEAALAREVQGDLDGAVLGYRAVVADATAGETSARAVRRLLSIQMGRQKAADELAYATTVIGNSTNYDLIRTVRRLRPGLLLAAGETSSAMSAYEEIIGDPSFDRAGVLFELAVQKGLVLKDSDGARDAVMRLQAISRDYHVLKHARAMLQEVVGNDIWVEIPEPLLASRDETPSAEELTLDQSTPNPMNPRTSIRFSLPRAGRVTLRIFDVHGRIVRTLIERDLPRGPHSVEWDGRSESGLVVASGVYHYRIDALGKGLTRKLIVVK